MSSAEGKRTSNPKGNLISLIYDNSDNMYAYLICMYVCYIGYFNYLSENVQALLNTMKTVYDYLACNILSECVYILSLLHFL